MNNKELQLVLQQLKDKNKQGFFSVKKSGNEPDAGLFIDANRNGVLSFCELLLDSIEESNLQRSSVYRISDEFQDYSEAWIEYIKVEEGNRNNVEPEQSLLFQVGCGAVLILGIIVFLAGIISTFQFIAKLF